MPKERLTDAKVASIPPPPPGKRVEILDEGCPGLWLRVTPTGSRSFALRFRTANKDARFTLGKHPNLSVKQARLAAIAALHQLARGVDPRDERIATDSGEITFAQIAEQFSEHRRSRRGKQALKSGHLAEMARRFSTVLLPRWGDRSFTEITRADVQALMDELEPRTPTLARHVWYDLKVLYKYALRRELATVSPLGKIEPPSKPEERDRVLSPDELKRVWRACDSPTMYHYIIKMLILTGTRRGEVAAAEWREFDLRDPLKSVWTISSSDTKNKREHRIPLSTLAVEILVAWRDHHTRLTANEPIARRHLFPSIGPGVHSATFVGFSKAKRRLDASANVHNWQVHDLRRTVATRLAEQGTLPHVVERILNHASGTMAPIARVYNRYAYEAEMRISLEQWAMHLRSLCDTNAGDSNVTELAEGARAPVRIA